jgi:hypothetical protein
MLVGKYEGKRPLGRPGHGLKYNIQMDLKQIVFEDTEWIHLSQDRVQWETFMNMVKILWDLDKAEFID